MSENSENSGPELPEKKSVVLPKGVLDGGSVSGASDYPEPEKRLRLWAIQNGYSIKYVHTHHLPDIDSFFVIFEAPKGR